ncbi:hypothetical protein C2G38_2256049 [Gigaspora rosea]|uniref:Uncharacterized protein n=1 Tax=Gigaspora rosea TaxID=44941 RepID=A0A397TUG7_9GLOM|nr:hypothetical protein C2G38_2256049 [Gigaspora rosea]
MFTATPMLELPMMNDQLKNAEKLELAVIALKISRTNLKVDIISKVRRFLNKKRFKKNAKRLQFLAKINSKRENLDVYAVAITLFLVLSGGFSYILWKIARYSYIKEFI